MEKIPLRNAQREIIAHSLVDEDDYERFGSFTWCISGGYVVRKRRKSDPIGSQTVRLHRSIMDTPKDKLTDHINGDKLDNRKKNLRICTVSQNQMNRGKERNNTSGYKGVTWFEKRKKWRVDICANKQSIHIGFFKDKIFAASAYNEAAKKHHGEFAKIN